MQVSDANLKTNTKHLAFENVKRSGNVINSDFICKYCKDLFEDVHQSSCGCRYCLKRLNMLEKDVCEICSEKIDLNYKTKDKAFQKEIDKYEVHCDLCSWIGKLPFYREHTKTHEKHFCPNCNETFFNNEILSEHLSMCNQNCPFASIGCKSPLNQCESFDDHLKNNVSKHLILLLRYIDPKVLKLDNQIQEIQKNANKPQESKNANNMITLYKEQNSNLAQYDKVFSIMLKEMNNLTLSHDKYELILKDYKTNEKKLRDELETTTRSLTCAQAVIITLEEEILSLKNITQNGMYVWKITHVRDKIQEAKSGRQTSIYSSPFYTSQYGYKMCARLYLNGDGIGRNTHLSLFFVIMRGEYDSLLKWPFKQKITFILIDQSQNENIVDSFKPDPNSNSFKKPTSDMNIASGIPLFCPLSKLYSTDHEYIKDDCMFVKVIVDSRDLVDF